VQYCLRERQLKINAAKKKERLAAASNQHEPLVPCLSLFARLKARWGSKAYVDDGYDIDEPEQPVNVKPKEFIVITRPKDPS
jgi:hypothetical protein